MGLIIYSLRPLLLVYFEKITHLKKILVEYLVFIYIPNKCNELDGVVYIYYMLVKHWKLLFFEKTYKKLLWKEKCTNNLGQFFFQSEHVKGDGGSINLYKCLIEHPRTRRHSYKMYVRKLLHFSLLLISSPNF